MALPDGKNITVGADGDWDFPNGTVLVKNFRLDNRLIETRLFMRHPDGVWAGYTYEWNEQQTDATLVRGGKRVTIAGQTWIYPSEGQCLQCHTEAAGRSLGLETRQLGFNITYPQTGRDAHQLVTHNAINTLTAAIANPTDQAPVSQSDWNGRHARRACALVPAHELLRSVIARTARRPPAWICVTRPYSRIPRPRRRARPRRARHHQRAAHRAGRRGTLRAACTHEPARRIRHAVVGSANVDADGAALLTEWINSLANCN